MFTSALREMAHGNQDAFACALDYHSAVRVGITDMDFFLAEKRRMPDSKFQMEYGSLFIGEEAGSLFPYDLTESCRTLQMVEYASPKKSTSLYVMGVDLATSGNKQADNAVIVVIKLIELEDGGYRKKMVYMRSYHGKRLDALADEVRKTYIRFPGIIKIVFDHRGLGDAFPQFLSQPWTDTESGKEYPPWVLDDEKSIIHNAQPLLRSVKANAQINQQMASALRVVLEQRSIEFPISSRAIVGNTLPQPEEDAEEPAKSRTLTMQEKAIYLETDALQIEMGTIIMKISTSGTYIYDTAKANQRKDRYSSLAMAVRFIAELEDERKRTIAQRKNQSCVGIVTTVQRRW